jgi:recombination protein RecR
MSALNELFTRVINGFTLFPGIGRKTAQRMAFHLLKLSSEELKNLAEAIQNLRKVVKTCPICNNITEGKECKICADPERDRATLCIVETAEDLWTIERGKFYKGVYHILGGTISPLQERGPKNLNLPKLWERLNNGGIKEVIIATNLTREGELTASFLASELKHFNVKITRLACGIPLGAELEFTDTLTLRQAFQSRIVV